MGTERDYTSFILGWVNTPLGFMGYIDCMRDGEKTFDRMFFSPAHLYHERGSKGVFR